MPALLSSCRRVGDEVRFDSGEQISCIIQDPGPGDATTPVAMEAILSLGKKSFFNLSSRPNNAPRPLAPRASKERKTLYGGLLYAEAYGDSRHIHPGEKCKFLRMSHS